MVARQFMADDKHLCGEHPVCINRLENAEKKIAMNCEELRKQRDKLDELNIIETHLTYIRKSLDDFKEAREQLKLDMKETKEIITKSYVPVERYKLVEKIVYGMAAIILITALNKLIKGSVF